ncbi:hypothetical protein BV898_09738 [Hypsibius exemplaris]|uniref:C-type lectin domain-containing protein n=1 Tax=Hypsibius exemplaris TaxID=2072580 RepID=A0A1W0WLQ0_HYPEX|nr:hypothetical protein BV898_09738 [Hypsibius exemplaris]
MLLLMRLAISLLLFHLIGAEFPPERGPSGYCPEGFFAGCTNRCYKIFNSTATWSVANAACNSINATLASIRDEGEQDCLNDYVVGTGLPYTLWIGLYKTGPNQKWNWINGAALHYFNWGPGVSPSEPNTEFCGFLLNGPGPWASPKPYWHDALCDKPTNSWSADASVSYNPGYICETQAIHTCESQLSPPPVRVSCSRGNLTKPVINLETDEILSTNAQFDGDQSNRCRHYAYLLHQWVAGRIDSHHRNRVPRNVDSGLVSITCVGNGEFTLSDSDSDAAETVSLSIEVKSTRKCRDFFWDFLGYIMSDFSNE